MNANSVLIVQPALPAYRVSLFNLAQQLLENRKLNVLATNLDHNGVKSVYPDKSHFNYEITANSIIFGGVCWQPKAVFRILTLKQSDTLVIFGNPRYLFNIGAALIAKLMGVEVIWWGQLWSLSTTKRSLRLKIRIMDIVSTKILLYTKQEARLLKMILPKKPIHFLNNGLDNSTMKNVRKPYIAEERSRRILFLGRLTPKANIQLLLRAMSDVDNAVLDVIGGLPSSRLKSQIADLKLTTKVKFHGEIHDEIEIAKIANECLFFVYPGSIGLSLIHAFNYGLPAVVHDQRRKHMPEISAFRPGINGKMFTYRDHHSLTVVIKEMLESPDQLNRFSNNALQVSETDFNTRVMARRFADTIILS